MSTLAIFLLLAAPVVAKPPPAYVTKLEACSGASPASSKPCVVPTRFSPEAVAELLGGRDSIWCLTRTV